MASETGSTTGTLGPQDPSEHQAARHRRLLDLFQELEHAVAKFDFFGLLRLVECLCPDRVRLGQATRIVEEPLRLSQDPSLAFPPSTFSTFTPPTRTRPARLAVHFLGLYGPNGPLPLHLTEYVRSRQVNANDSSLVRFLDIFHHRILSLFYRAWANCEPVVSCDRPTTDRFAVYVGSLLGYGLSSQSNRDAFPDPCKRYYAGLFAQQRRNAEGLNDMISDYFGLPVNLEEFIGEWLPLQAEDRWNLGGRRSTGCLGNGTVLGSNTWQRQTKFRLSFGPLSEADFNSFLPDGSRYTVLKSMVRNYVGDSLEWDLRLIPHQRDSQPFLLGNHSRLGWTSWLGKCPRGEIREDLIFSPIHESSPLTFSRYGKAHSQNSAVGTTAGR